MPNYFSDVNFSSSRISMSKYFSATFLIPFGVVGLSILLYVFFIQTETLENRLLYDAAGYVDLATKIESFEVYDPLRTLGYPVFLFLIKRTAAVFAIQNWIPVVYYVQFIFHVATSFFGARIFSKLCQLEGIDTRKWQNILVFCLIQLNLCLLPLAFETLTDSICVFFISVVVFVLFSSHSWKTVWVGSLFGLLALVKPFYGPFFVASIGIFMFLFFVNSKREKGRWKSFFSLAIPLILSFLVICTPQIATIFKHEHRIGLVGYLSSYPLSDSKLAGKKTYKYETLPTNAKSPIILYLRTPLFFTKPKLGNGLVRLGNIFNFLADSTMFYILKTVGLFQSFDWSVYRTSSSANPSHPVFLYGFINFFFFLYMSLGLFERLVTRNKQKDNLYLITVNTSGIFHVLLYSLLVHCESRYIAPALPIFIIFGFYYLVRDARFLKLLSVFTVSMVLYISTFHIMTKRIKVFTWEEL